MSLGYAQKLSYIEDVGQLGMVEIFDSPHVLQEKIEQLSMMMKKSKHLVVFTGAGISTSSGIPDFRGPKGIWTLQHEGKPLPESSLPFHRAMPSVTHMALVALEKAGMLKFVISQNIDGLHLRSGIAREKLAELHGNSFMETCPSCGAEYYRDFEVETIGLKVTSRRCSYARCGARLRDTVLDWEDALPPKEMNLAEKHCKMADVVLCLGTSLQITPACNLPLRCLRGGGKIVIVNLQETPKDKKASLVIHGLMDQVVSGVMDSLNLSIPPFVRIDLFRTIITQTVSTDRRFVNWTLTVGSVHGPTAPLPFIKHVEVAFLDCPNFKAAILHKQPFKLKRRTARMKTFEVVLKLGFSDGCCCRCTEIKIPMDFEGSSHFCDVDKDAIIQYLKDKAIQDGCCGQNAVVEKAAVLATKSDVSVYAIVTNIITYNSSKAFEAASVNNGDVKMHNNSFNGTTRDRSRGRKRKSRF